MYSSNVNPVALHFVNDAINSGSTKFLEFGCWTGALGTYVKDNNDVEWLGIEKNNNAIEIARANLNVLHWDCNRGIQEIEEYIQWAEVILLVDVLEHLYEPIDFLNELIRLSNDKAKYVFVLPNIECHQVIEKLANNLFEYEDAGILDKTHRYFWTPRSFVNDIENCNLKIVDGPYFLMNEDGKRLYHAWEESGRISLMNKEYNIEIKAKGALATSICSYGYGFLLSK